MPLEASLISNIFLLMSALWLWAFLCFRPHISIFTHPSPPIKSASFSVPFYSLLSALRFFFSIFVSLFICPPFFSLFSLTIPLPFRPPLLHLFPFLLILSGRGTLNVGVKMVCRPRCWKKTTDRRQQSTGHVIQTDSEWHGLKNSSRTPNLVSLTA